MTDDAPFRIPIRGHGASVSSAFGHPLVLLAPLPVLAGPALAVVAYLLDQQKAVPSDGSTFVCMGVGFTLAGLFVAGLMLFFARAMREQERAARAGEALLFRRQGGVVLRRVDAAGEVLFEGFAPAVALVCEEVQTRNRDYTAVRLVRADGGPLGPDRGTLLHRAFADRELVRAQTASLAAEVAAFQRH